MPIELTYPSISGLPILLHPKQIPKQCYGKTKWLMPTLQTLNEDLENPQLSTGINKRFNNLFSLLYFKYCY